MHLVGACLQPGEEAFHPVPDLLRPGALALDHPAARLGGQLAPRRVEGNAPLLREFLQVLLAFAVGLGLPGLDGAAAQRAGLVGNDQPIVDADGAPEATAGLARAQRRVERELAGGGRVVRQVAVCAVQLARVAPGVQRLRRIALIHHLHVDASAADAQRGLERLEHPAALGAAGPQPVLHHFQRDGRRVPRALAALAATPRGGPRRRRCGWRCGNDAAQEAGIALSGQQLTHFVGGEVRRHRYRKAHDQSRIAGVLCARAQVGVDAVRGVAPHELTAAPAEQRRGACEQQLQVIVELGHRADGRARGAHRVRLVDGDGGGNSRDRLDLRLVHAVEELPGVGGEGLDVTALAFRVQGVEHQRRLARARHAGDHDQLIERKVEIEALQVVLARATHEDGVTAGVGHSVTVGCGEGYAPAAGRRGLRRL